MQIEIHEPKLERRVREGVESGRFRDLDELLVKALDALSQKEASGAASIGHIGFDAEKARQAVANVRELRKGVRLDLQGLSIRSLAHLGH